MYLLQKEKGLLETSRAGWEVQERVLRVKIQHREEQLEGGEVGIIFCSKELQSQQISKIALFPLVDGSWRGERSWSESSNRSTVSDSGKVGQV